ncbi:hypothetical protein C2G38_2218742 [Gigaspora rosea]|uniref:Uncharacterized protein n=1 Tax=Gigaspora rosea TaxID=44941 RepID=A0A397U646_9GLOM|nr:hypothetical protein C2G38_2218742 [Gigaspora rosea]
MGNKQPGQHPGQNTFITDNNNNNSNDKADKDDINDDNAQISDDELYLSDEQGGTTFVLTTKMQTLPTKIYKNNILQAEESQKLLQSFLQNKLIRPLNNAIKLANKTKPPSDKKEAGEDIAIKSIYPNYQSKPEVEPLFGEDLESIIFKENEKNKPEKFKHIYTLAVFQNRKYKPSKIFAEQMGYMLCVQGLALWANYKSKSLYEGAEASNRNDSYIGNKDYRFIINKKKLVLEPTMQVKFLGFDINSTSITLAIPRRKERTKLYAAGAGIFTEFIIRSQISVRKLDLQLQEMEQKRDHSSNPDSGYLYRCFQNRLRAIINSQTAYGLWNKEQRTNHINFLELAAIKKTILT